MLKWVKRLLCSHEVCIWKGLEMLDPNGDDRRVKGTCHKCGTVMFGHCGLSLPALLTQTTTLAKHIQTVPRRP
jgi:hypothetical protein